MNKGFKTLDEIKRDISVVGDVKTATYAGNDRNDTCYIVYTENAENTIDRILRREGYYVGSDYYDSVVYTNGCPRQRFILYRY